MYAKSFIAHASRGRLTSAMMAKMYPYDHYVCHLRTRTLVFHPEWGTHRPWFEHTDDALTESGRQHCPYAVAVPDEQHIIQRLRRLVTDAHLAVCHADWHCSGCRSHYHGERYCLHCKTGEHNTGLSGCDTRPSEVTVCAC
ncbi:putative zinc ribbon protein [Serratia surfactantfaciens]|uniref:putative zinc ribbon protein n=1 Tax=Serratia surfactantfaciens TaxID=2741499 RepID=UPI003EDEFA36